MVQLFLSVDMLTRESNTIYPVENPCLVVRKPTVIPVEKFSFVEKY
jgi:hypothetical protein